MVNGLEPDLRRSPAGMVFAVIQHTSAGGPIDQLGICSLATWTFCLLQEPAAGAGPLYSGLLMLPFGFGLYHESVFLSIYVSYLVVLFSIARYPRM